MIGKERRFGPLDKILQSFEMLAIQSIGGAEIHRHAMLNHFVLFENFVEHFQGSTAVAHVIFADDLEPVARRLVVQDVTVMRHAQADADAKVGECIEAICGH